MGDIKGLQNMIKFDVAFSHILLIKENKLKQFTDAQKIQDTLRIS